MESGLEPAEFLRRYADRWRALDLLLAGIRLQSES